MPSWQAKERGGELRSLVAQKQFMTRAGCLK